MTINHLKQMTAAKVKNEADFRKEREGWDGANVIIITLAKNVENYTPMFPFFKFKVLSFLCTSSKVIPNIISYHIDDDVLSACHEDFLRHDKRVKEFRYGFVKVQSYADSEYNQMTKRIRRIK